MKDAYENEQLRIQVAALTALTSQAPLNPAPLPPPLQAQQPQLQQQQQQQQFQEHQQLQQLHQQNQPQQSTPGRKRQNSEPIGAIAKGSRLSQPSEPGLNQVEATFEVVNQGHMRHEIKIGLMTLNGKKFIGTITPQEAKFIIYRESLGFPDFSNFDRVRFAYRGVPVVVFKLKTALNVDELIGIQNFEFKRTS